jgi:hypothetical protein
MTGRDLPQRTASRSAHSQRAHDDAHDISSPRGVSSLAFVLGFYFGLAAIVVSGLILAISAAAILQNIDFGSLEGIAIIVLCLTVNQIAYLIGATLASRAPKNATRSLT